MPKDIKAHAEDKSVKTVDAKTVVETPIVETKKEATISELIGSEKPVARTVPEATFLKLKRELKDLKKQQSKPTINNSSLKELADKHDLDVDFLEDLSQSIRNKTKSEIEEEIAERLQPLEQKEKDEKIDRIFEEQYQKTIDKLPEYKNISNKEVIKALSLDPNNANKTFAQLVEMSYGHLVKGKKTIESASVKTYNNNETSLDIERANKDPEYFKAVMENPTLKKKYNENLIDSVSQYM